MIRSIKTVLPIVLGALGMAERSMAAPIDAGRAAACDAESMPCPSVTPQGEASIDEAYAQLVLDHIAGMEDEFEWRSRVGGLAAGTMFLAVGALAVHERDHAQAALSLGAGGALVVLGVTSWGTPDDGHVLGERFRSSLMRSRSPGDRGRAIADLDAALHEQARVAHARRLWARAGYATGFALNAGLIVQSELDRSKSKSERFWSRLNLGVVTSVITSGFVGTYYPDPVERVLGFWQAHTEQWRHAGQGAINLQMGVTAVPSGGVLQLVGTF